MSRSIITAKAAIEIVLERKAKTARLSFFDTNLEKYTFFISCAFMAIGAICGLIAYFWKNTYVVLVALCSVALSIALAAIYQLAGAWSEFSKIKEAERAIGKQLVDVFNDDLDLIGELARDFQKQHLEYAKDCFSTMAEQLRSRLSLLVGALDKVGLIPLAITAYISWAKAKKDGLVFEGTEWLAVAFGVLYLFAIHMTTVAQWMDRIALIYKQALAVQATQKTS